MSTDNDERNRYLTNGVKFGACYVPKHYSNQDIISGKAQFNYAITLWRGRNVLHSNYSMGLGHWKGYRANNRSDDYVAMVSAMLLGLRRTLQPIPPADLPTPTIADVVYCLHTDGAAIDMTHAEWCSEYGYDPDSIKALGIYNACRETGILLYRIYDRAKLDQLFEGY